jgi:hypothetical protein
MKLFLAFLFLSSGLAFADARDPLDPSSCEGPLLSNERALELLGPSRAVNLSRDMPEGRLYGYSRIRQKLGGAVGQWHESRLGLVPVRPILSNHEGELRFEPNYDVVRTTYDLDCELVAPAADRDHYVCQPREDFPRFASGTLYATVTDQCIRFFSYSYGKGEDQEWAYLLRY